MLYEQLWVFHLHLLAEEKQFFQLISPVIEDPSKVPSLYKYFFCISCLFQDAVKMLILLIFYWENFQAVLILLFSIIFTWLVTYMKMGFVCLDNIIFASILIEGCFNGFGGNQTQEQITTNCSSLKEMVTVECNKFSSFKIYIDGFESLCHS
jgi:hypothetical protein